jgi:hypothetical protein
MVPHFRDETYGDVKTPGYNHTGTYRTGIKRRDIKYRDVPKYRFDDIQLASEFY